MKLPKFETEDYFDRYEFTKAHLVSASDCESLSIGELLALGGGSVEELLRIDMGYTEMLGSQRLRHEIAAQYESVGADQVMVLGAPIEGIYTIFRALLEEKDHVIVLSPGYDALFNVANAITGNVSRWFLQQEGNGWLLDFERLEVLLRRPTKLLVLNFPHNPTGFHPSQADWRRILDLAERAGTRVFSDEMYRGLEYREEDRLPSAVDCLHSAIVLGGLSKSYGLPGLRFGWLATKDRAAFADLYRQKTYTSMCANKAGEYLGHLALGAAPALQARSRGIIQRNLDAASRAFDDLSLDVRWLPPSAGSVSAIRFYNVDSVERLCCEIADEYGVVLLPIRYMGAEDKYARLGLGRANFTEKLPLLTRALAQKLQKTQNQEKKYV